MSPRKIDGQDLWQPLPCRNIFDANAKELAMDDKTRTELEAAVYRRLVEHLRGRTDVQNIDMRSSATPRSFSTR